MVLNCSGRDAPEELQAPSASRQQREAADGCTQGGVEVTYRVMMVANIGIISWNEKQPQIVLHILKGSLCPGLTVH